MKNGLLATVATAMLFLACTQANAEDATPGNGMYVSVFGGASFPENVKTNISSLDYSVDLKTGYLLGGAIGMNITEMIRGEVELSHSSWKADSFVRTGGKSDSGSVAGSINSTYVLANVWVDINNDTAFTPYAGGGAGVGWADGNAKFSGGGYGNGEAGFAFQLGVGLKYDLTENIGLDLGYRYKSILGVDFQDLGSTNVYKSGDVSSHDVQLGLTYSF